MMFGRFTERAQKVLALSQEEAVRLGHKNIGTEHILLGLVREGEGIAAKALQSLGLEVSKIQEEVEKLIGVDKQPIAGQGVGLVGTLSAENERRFQEALDAWQKRLQCRVRLRRRARVSDQKRGAYVALSLSKWLPGAEQAASAHENPSTTF